MLMAPPKHVFVNLSLVHARIYMCFPYKFYNYLSEGRSCKSQIFGHRNVPTENVSPDPLSSVVGTLILPALPLNL